ncbi:MAG: DUF3794 domain-containing protein [Clostridia bacterium]|nr:DUF3794 domain-containing protein [Clostridia bacterium]
MAVKLHREHLRLSTALCSRYMQTTVESDVIVPDIKPDILKILQVGNEVVITRKEVQNDRVFVQGIVRMNVLYTPDNGILGALKSISAHQEFNHSMDINGAMPGMELFIDAEADPAEYTLVNSRKLSIRSKISLSARLSNDTEVDIATGVDDTSAIETKCKNMNIYNPCIDVARDIILREKLEVPAGKSPICEVLKVSAKPYSIELKTLDGKAMAKGELKVCTLYCGDDENTAPDVMEHILPFSEILEIDGLREGMAGEVDFALKDLYFEVCPDSDGDKKILSIEATIEAEVRAFDVVECSAIEDAYSLCNPVELKKTLYSVEQLVANCSNQTTVKEPVSVPDYLPEIYRLCDYSANPSIESVSVDKDEVTVSGYINCNFLYLSEDSANPASCFSHILPFTQHFDVVGATQNSVCEAKAEMEHISCTISSGRCLEVRAIVSTSIKVVEPTSVELVSEINCDDETALPKMPSMSVYFIQKGDSLWSIAKKYRTSPDKILSANGENPDSLKPGKCIYIFR